MDIIPSTDLFHHLITFYSQKKTDEYFNNTLYVIPTFEIDIDTLRHSLPVPQNKRELTILWNDKQIQPYENQTCPSCQSLTNYVAWLEEKKDDHISVLYRPHYHLPWRPYFVGDKKMPFFDSRFKTHAHARISQVSSMFLS